jgi:hypothetical protein
MAKKMVIKSMRGYAYEGQSLESGLEREMPVEGKALSFGWERLSPKQKEASGQREFEPLSFAGRSQKLERALEQDKGEPLQIRLKGATFPLHMIPSSGVNGHSCMAILNSDKL